MLTGAHGLAGKGPASIENAPRETLCAKPGAPARTRRPGASHMRRDLVPGARPHLWARADDMVAGVSAGCNWLLIEKSGQEAVDAPGQLDIGDRPLTSVERIELSTPASSIFLFAFV